MNRKTLLIAGIAGVVLLALLVSGAAFLLLKKGGGNRSVTNASAETEDLSRRNILNLVRDYIEQGEYQRALDHLDSLLIADSGDAEARELRDAALREKAAASAAANAAAAESAAALAAGVLGASRDRSALSAGGEAAAREREERLRAQEAEAAAGAAAEAERRAAAEAEAARRRAQEEELARASRELQAQMRAVNDLVSQGKERLGKDDLPGAAAVFADARSRMPPGETRFEAQKLADMAEGYYGVYARNPNTETGAQAAREATALASESAKKDPEQAQPHSILGKLYRDLHQWDNAAAEFREAVRLEPDNYLYSFDLGRVYFSGRKYADARQ
ncbi:MAG: hypothetical protein LBG42_09315, partial [Treponema sp.]|nr:hypothetical protein [Treponema sp.]